MNMEEIVDEKSEKSMKKMTVIDGMNVIVTTCGNCPFYDGGDE